MNIILPWMVSGKLYLWKLFHSLINYFFNLHIKKAYNINENCYIFIKRLGKRNEILINYINCGLCKYFQRLEFRFIKFTMSLMKQIPIINIKSIEFTPIILAFKKSENRFKIWKNAYESTLDKMNILDSLREQFRKFVIFRISIINLYLKSYKFNISYLRLIKNDNKTRISLARCKIYFKNIYIGSLINVRLSYDSNTDNINIYGDKMIIIVSNNFLKFQVLEELSEIVNMFKNDDEGKMPNIFFKEVIIQFTINNHFRLNLTECFFEDFIIKCNILIKIWQKEIMWLKKCSYNICNNELDIDNVRIRLFKSTADKIFKTFRPLYKHFYRSKSTRNKKILKKENNDKLNCFSKIDLNYLENISNDNDKLFDSDLQEKYSPILNNNYMNNCNSFKISKLFNVKKLTIDFQNKNGSFIFYDFLFNTGDSGFSISCSRWIFIKNNIIFLDNVNNQSKFVIEYRDNSLLIFPYHLYLNFSIDDFGDTFSEFTRSVGRITDIFSSGCCSKNNYIYEKFYINSTRLLFSYKSKPIKMLKLLSGKYQELINVLNIKELDFILREVTINYPKNFNYILSQLIAHLLDDIIENNFETVIKSTPISATYKLKKIIDKIPRMTHKVCNIIN